MCWGGYWAEHLQEQGSWGGTLREYGGARLLWKYDEDFKEIKILGRDGAEEGDQGICCKVQRRDGGCPGAIHEEWDYEPCGC